MSCVGEWWRGWWLVISRQEEPDTRADTCHHRNGVIPRDGCFDKFVGHRVAKFILVRFFAAMMRGKNHAGGQYNHGDGDERDP